MPLKIGSSDVGKVYVGSTEAKVYIGGTLVYPSVQWNVIWSGGMSVSLNQNITVSNIPSGTQFRITYQESIVGYGTQYVVSSAGTSVTFTANNYIDEGSDVYEIVFAGFARTSNTNIRCQEIQSYGNVPGTSVYITKIEAYY